MSDIEQGFPNFDGKTVVFYSTRGKTVASIESPQFEEQAGQWFVVGKAAVSKKNWAHGSYAAVAWEKVFSYIVTEVVD